MKCLNCNAAELTLPDAGHAWVCPKCNRAFSVEAVKEIERLRLGILAASHLLLAATGPEDAPGVPSWAITERTWRAVYRREVAETAKA